MTTALSALSNLACRMRNAVALSMSAQPLSDGMELAASCLVLQKLVCRYRGGDGGVGRCSAVSKVASFH